MRFRNRIKDYLQVCSIGFGIGLIMLFIDFLPHNTLWNIPTLALLYGFWIVSVAVLIWRSTSHITAGLNAFLYILFVSFSFYALRFLLGLCTPLFSQESFPFKALLNDSLSALIIGIISIVLYFWNHGSSWYSAILLALPIGILTAETIEILGILQTQQTHLFQLLFNAGFGLYLGLQFRKMTKHKEIYTVTIMLITWLINQYFQ